jgi:hypothetical protein
MRRESAPSMVKTALAYLAAGRSVVPIAPGRKVPSAVDPKTGRRRLIRWERYRHARATPAEVRRWFAGPQPVGLGIVAGAASGATLPDGTRAGLEFLVVRGAALHRRFVSRLAARGEWPLLERLPCEQTPGGGRQYGYLCVEWSTSTTLARRYAGTMPDGRGRTATLVETKGEGSPCVVAPTPVGTRPTPPEQGYTMVRGRWTHIPIISPEARRLLWACARALDTSSASTRPSPRRHGVQHPPAGPIPADRHQGGRPPRPRRVANPKPDDALTAAPSPVPGGTRKAAERRRLQDAWVAFLGQWRWEWSLDLTFRGIVHPEEADKRFRRFVPRMNRDAYGSRWRERGWGFRWARGSEYQRRGAIHFHVLMTAVGLTRPRRLRPRTWMKIWHKLGGYGKVRKLESLWDEMTARRYLCKGVPDRGEVEIGGPRRRGKRLPRPEPRASGPTPPERCPALDG